MKSGVFQRKRILSRLKNPRSKEENLKALSSITEEPLSEILVALMKTISRNKNIRNRIEI